LKSTEINVRGTSRQRAASWELAESIQTSKPVALRAPSISDDAQHEQAQ
jgi:hypothetical protein